MSIYEVISWIGLAICMSAFFVKDLLMLRIYTLIGCFLLGIYYTHIDVAQGMISNVILIAINAYYLVRAGVNKVQANRANDEEQHQELVRE